MKSVRARSQVPLKFFIWYPHAPSVLFLLHGPANRGCVKDLRSKLELTASKLAPEDTIEEVRRLMTLFITFEMLITVLSRRFGT